MWFPDNPNGRALRSMHSSGADMSSEYDIDFEHVFPDLRSAERMIQMVASVGHWTELSEFDGDDHYYYQVRVVARMVPTYDSVTGAEQALGSLAASCDGRPDGWGILHGPYS